MSLLDTAIAKVAAVLTDPSASAAQKANARRAIAAAAGKDDDSTTAPPTRRRANDETGKDKPKPDEDVPSLEDVIEMLRQVEDDAEASDDEKKKARQARRELGDETVVDEKGAAAISRAMNPGDPFKQFTERQLRALRGGR